MIFSFGMTLVCLAEPRKSFTWDPPKVAKSIFSHDLGMLDTEREDYASNLAGHAVNQLIAAKATVESITNARRMFALALHLSPRNKRALVANSQLSKGVFPEVSKTDYSPQVFARLMLTRGQLLDQQGGDENRKLARMFIQLAAGMDPKNQDAIQASKIQRLEQGEIDWSTITHTP